MASNNDNPSMAVFCDFENLALGVRDAQYDKFDIRPVLERLLLKGSIVVKKAYCDWERYKGFKAVMHEANFELIEIPHVRQSGKNSADIRMVVDALDLCYTKGHVDTFVILSGDSDFSPLVSKLRENAKQVIGVGIKQSTSDLLVANCDEFIFYDDLVRESQRRAGRREGQGGGQNNAPRRSPEEERRRREEQDARRTRGVELAVETFDALMAERGDSGKIWASVLKEAIKRRRPDFSEGNYAFRTFGNLLEEASARGLLGFGRDEKSGAYVFRGAGAPVRHEPRDDEAQRHGEGTGTEVRAPAPRPAEERPMGIYEARALAQREAGQAALRTEEPVPPSHAGDDAVPEPLADTPLTDASTEAAASGAMPPDADAVPREPRQRSRGGRERAARGREDAAPATHTPATDEAPATTEPAADSSPMEEAAGDHTEAAPAAAAKRPRRPRKTPAKEAD